MDNLLLNPLTARRLQAFLAHPSHAVLLSGEQGSGLHSVGHAIYKSLTGAANDADGLVSVEPNDKNTISIEDIRTLQHRLKLSNNKEGVAITVMIGAVEAMQAEAQNALLKLLEEPPMGVLFILLCHDTSKLLQTISSRCVQVAVLPVSLEHAQQFFNTSDAAFTKNYHLSGGKAGLLCALQSDQSHPLVTAIAHAKSLLAATAYERLKTIDADYKTRDKAAEILQALYRTCSAALQSGTSTERWVHNTKLVATAIKKLEANVQAKVLLGDLFLHLR